MLSTPKDSYGPFRLLSGTALIAVLLLLVPAAAAGRKPSLPARAKKALYTHGYRQIRVSCSARKSRCNWRAIRAGRTCSGRIFSPKTRHPRMRISGVHCVSNIVAVGNLPGGGTQTGAGGVRLPLYLGFNAYTTPTTVSKQRLVGATVTRLFVDWSQVEPSPGSWNWSSFDQQYQQILAGGLRPVLVAFAAPCWAQGPGGCSLTYASPPAPANDGAWSEFVRQLTARYPQAAAIEVWNEPNLGWAFYPQVDPARYTQLLSEAYGAVKSVNPRMPVVSGGVAMSDNEGGIASAYASRTFLSDMFADGARRYMDALGIHIYPTDTIGGGPVWDPAAMSRWLAQVHSVEAAAGVGHVPIWVTEMGVSTATQAGFPPAATEQQQATDLLDMINFAQGDPDVQVTIIDTLQDAIPDLIEDLISSIGGALFDNPIFYNQIIEGLGVFHSDWTPKPAACGVSRAFAGSLTC
jgi:hypothetical protein